MQKISHPIFSSVTVFAGMFFILPSLVYAAPLTGGLCGEEFTTPGTYSFSVPAGISQISVTATGGGAGGGGGAWDSNETSPGTGGGGGAAAVMNYIINPPGGATYSATVGSGGVGGVANWNIWGGNPVGTGGESTFLDINGVTNLLLPGGGTSYSGTDYYESGGPAGGSGGTNGATGYRACGGAGGAGGDTLLGVGGATTYGAGLAGSNGTGFGAGGSGASAGCYGGGAVGGNGAGGYMRVEWACPAVNTIPTADILIPTTDTTVTPGQDVIFSGIGSDLDAGDSITGYEWRENSCDASGALLSTASSFTLTNPSVTTRTIYLRVKDESGAWSTNCPHRVITVSPPPAPDIVSENFTSAGAFTLGNTITFTGTVANRGVVDMDTTNSHRHVKLGGAPSLVGSGIYDISVVGDYAYTTVIGNDKNSLETFNISNPANPINMGAIETWYNGNFEILNRGSYLYAMKGSGGQVLHVYDISVPSAPVYVASSTGGNYGSSMLGMDIVGSYAYLATNGTNDGLEIFDISNPLAPFEAGTPGNTLLQDDTATEAAVYGNYAYLAGQAFVTTNGTGFVDVFNVSNPALPARVMRINTPTHLSTAIVRGTYLYVGGGNWFYVYSLADPENPILISSTNVGADVTKIRFSGNIAYTAGFSAADGVRMFNITNPAAPVLIGRTNVTIGSYGILPTQTKIYIANNDSVVGGHDLNIFEPHTFTRFCIDNPSCLTTTTGQLGGKDFDAGRLAVNGTYATSTTWVATLGAHTAYFCTDVKDTNNFDGVAESNETNNCESISFTVTNPPAPDIVAENFTPGGTYAVGTPITLSGNVKNQGAVGMNTNNAYQLLKIKGLVTDGSAFGLARSGNNVYVVSDTTGQNLEIYDTTNPISAARIGGVSYISGAGIIGAGEVAVANNYAYTTNENSSSKLRVIDVSDVSNPTLVSAITYGFGTRVGLYISGNYLYVAGNGTISTADDLTIYDISNPASPVRVGGVASPLVGTGWDVVVVGNYAYLTLQGNTGNSFEIYDISNPVSPVFVSGLQPSIPARSALGIAVVGNYAYVGYPYVGPGENFIVIDISNPANPFKVSGVDTGVNVYDVKVQSKYAFLAAYQGGIKVYDISNPANVIRVGGGVGNPGTGIVLTDNFAYLTANTFANNEGFQIFEPRTFARFCINSASCLTSTTGRLGGKDFDAGRLDVNASYATSTVWTPTAIGTYTAYLCTDTKDTGGFDGVAESDETNNCQSSVFTIVAAPTKTNTLSPLSQTITVGGPITFTSTATFSDNSMTEHNLNWKKQGGCWNWDTGCYTPVASVTQSNYAFPATGSHSLSTTFIPTESGTYEVQAAAYDGFTWTYSPLATITVNCSSLFGEQCTSTANSCGMTNLGTYQCDGTCGAVTPSNQLCPPVSNCGNGICEGSGAPPETPLSCPQDCKLKVKQF